MARELVVVGLSWRTAPVSLRERLAFTDGELDAALRALRAGPVNEALILSTCNRVEIYAAAPAAAPESTREQAAAAVRTYLASSRGIDSESLSQSLYEHGSIDAVRHIFRVASSLDSMVVGESQILGQLKDAYGRATAAGTTSAILGRCLERSFRVAKRVRSETEISRGSANVSSVAVDLAVRVFGELAGKSVLLIGAGKMSALAARHLRRAGAANVLVVNRSIDKAEQLAAEVDGEARAWGELDDLLVSADVVIASTGSREPVLTKKQFKKVARKRRYRPLLVVDIAVPRDADPAIASHEGVYLFDIDDLEKVVAETLKQRSHQAEAGAEIVEAETRAFESWARSQLVVPTIRTLREHFIGVASAEAEKAAAEIARADDPEVREKLARKMADRIAKKLLHAPMIALKSDDTDIDAMARLTRTLFALERDEVEVKEPAAPTGAPVPAEAKKK